MKVNKSIQKLSKLPENNSICNKYGLSIDDPIVHRKKTKNMYKRIKKNKLKKQGSLIEKVTTELCREATSIPQRIYISKVTIKNHGAN